MKEEELKNFEKATKGMNPMHKAILRIVRGSFVIILFIVSITFLYPNLTGNVIGPQDSTKSFIGIIMFIFALAGLFMLIQKYRLMKKYYNK